VRKCPYCDFNSHAVKQGIPEQAYIEALLTDLDQELLHLPEPRPLNSIFMGGGTPSLFSAASLENLLQGIAQRIVKSP
jgi:oxygen-independent coproporphyrinogen-3 oxidase